MITSLYLLSMSINLVSILYSIYYDLSISFPYLSLITPQFCYSISFCAYSYPVSSILIHIVGYHSSIRHRTQLLMSIHSHLNTPYPLSSFMLSRFYPSIHILLCHFTLSSPSSLTTLLHSHSSSHSCSLSLFIIYPSLFPFIPFHIILSLPFYSHSILHPFPFQHHSPILFFLSLLQTLFYSILYFYSPLCSQTPIYYHSTPLTASPHPSLYHYPLPHSFTQHLFNSFSSLLSFVLSTRTIFFTIPIHSPIIYLFQSLLPPYH